MKTYAVEFTRTIVINAENENEAEEKACWKLDFAPDNFYAYVTEEEYNPEYNDEEDEE